jgi:hypothetical protein
MAVLKQQFRTPFSVPVAARHAPRRNNSRRRRVRFQLQKRSMRSALLRGPTEDV